MFLTRGEEVPRRQIRQWTQTWLLALSSRFQEAFRQWTVFKVPKKQLQRRVRGTTVRTMPLWPHFAGGLHRRPAMRARELGWNLVFDVAVNSRRLWRGGREPERA